MPKIKDKKVQVLLSSSDYKRLKDLILRESLECGRFYNISSYIRELILSHIKRLEGEQKSLTVEYIKNDILKIDNENERK